MRSSVHRARNAPTPPPATAASTPPDQNSCDTASTAIAGHSRAHCARGFKPYAAIAATICGGGACVRARVRAHMPCRGGRAPRAGRGRARRPRRRRGRAPAPARARCRACGAPPQPATPPRCPLVTWARQRAPARAAGWWWGGGGRRGRGAREAAQTHARRRRWRASTPPQVWDPGAPAPPRAARRAFSPSALFIAVMASAGAGPKSRDAIASKHLRRCGCTASGLRAWLRICAGRGGVFGVCCVCPLAPTARRRPTTTPARARAQTKQQPARACTASSPPPPALAPPPRRLQQLVVGQEEQPRKGEALRLQVRREPFLHALQRAAGLGQGVQQPRRAARLRARAAAAGAGAGGGRGGGGGGRGRGLAGGVGGGGRRQGGRRGGRARRGARALMTPGARRAASIALRHPRSTAAKRLASAGSCVWMSSDANTGSRYIHARCSAPHCSSTSDTWRARRARAGA